MKYVMFEADFDGEKVAFPFVFPDNLVHKIVAVGLKAVLAAHKIDAWPVSAGTVSIFGTEIRCSGESETLKLKSRPIDAGIIHNYDYSHGVSGSWMDAILARAMKEKK